MDAYYDKDRKKIKVNGQDYEPQPGIMDRLKESFSTVQDKAQLEAVRKRREKLGQTNG